MLSRTNSRRTKSQKISVNENFGVPETDPSACFQTCFVESFRSAFIREWMNTKFGYDAENMTPQGLAKPDFPFCAFKACKGVKLFCSKSRPYQQQLGVQHGVGTGSRHKIYEVQSPQSKFPDVDFCMFNGRNILFLEQARFSWYVH